MQEEDMELQAIFDRDDRLYRFGDVISGRVVLEPDYDSTYSKIWITYRWRTHGKGNRDEGKQEELTLAAEKTSIRAGERREFRFRFAAPNGPVTYHGYLLNVDWYLTVHARSIPRGYFKSEQDFLLQAGDPTGAVVLGTKEIPRIDLPARPTEVPRPSYELQEAKAGSSQPPGLWSKKRNCLLGLSGFLFVFFIGLSLLPEFINWYPPLAFIIPIVILILLAAVAEALYRNAYRRKLKLGETWVRPARVYGGSEVYCHVDFVARQGFHLRSIIASISSRERISRTAGTASVTEIHVLDEKTYSRPFNEDLSEGRWVAFDCALPVGPDAPASFSSTNNALEWIVTMKAELKGWPAWQKTFPITVLAKPDVGTEGTAAKQQAASLARTAFSPRITGTGTTSLSYGVRLLIATGIVVLSFITFVAVFTLIAILAYGTNWTGRFADDILPFIILVVVAGLGGIGIIKLVGLLRSNPPPK
jgi:hypothetical protein